jgi:hypothetical protein
VKPQVVYGFVLVVGEILSICGMGVTLLSHPVHPVIFVQSILLNPSYSSVRVGSPGYGPPEMERGCPGLLDTGLGVPAVLCSVPLLILRRRCICHS